jgi:hypothetical protein
VDAGDGRLDDPVTGRWTWTSHGASVADET